MTDLSPDRFHAVRRAAEAAVFKAKTLSAEERDKLGTIDWNDLRVGEVTHCRSEYGDTWFLVDVGKASPQAMLGYFVCVEVAKALPGARIEVRTGW